MTLHMKTKDKAQKNQLLEQSIGRHVILAGATIFLLVGIGGLWSASTKISSAVIAHGQVVVEGDVKQISHREGGIVGEILVEEGQEVVAGEVLIRLDDTLVRNNYTILTSQLIELEAQSARLKAEFEEESTVNFPDRKYDMSHDSYEEIKTTQLKLLTARSGSLDKLRGQFKEQIEQLEKQINGLETRLETKQRELELVDEELKDSQKLFEKNLVTKNRITQLKRDQTRLSGEYGELGSQIAGLNETISETNMKWLQNEERNREEILDELQSVTAEITEKNLQRISLEDQLGRLDVRAPLAGFVHQLDAHTVGGVIPPASTILQIVPKNDQLVIDAKVDPTDIDQVYLGQETTIRLPSLDQRQTPKLSAKVHTIAADQTFDDALQRGYYHVRLQVTEGELAKLGDTDLIPGMPAEAFISTGQRTVLAYLSKPILDQIAHSMKES